MNSRCNMVFGIHKIRTAVLRIRGIKIRPVLIIQSNKLLKSVVLCFKLDMNTVNSVNSSMKWMPYCRGYKKGP